MNERDEDLTSRNEEALDSVVEIELAVERGEVTFPMVMKALRLQWSAPRADLRERYRNLYRPALSDFMERYGGISESFYADEFAAGALLTRKDELFSMIWWDEFKFDTIPVRTLEVDINDLWVRVGLYLSKDHRRICMQRLFRLYKGLVASLRAEYSRWPGTDPGKAEPCPTKRHIADLGLLRRELEGVQEDYRCAGLARGQALYVTGAALGTVAIVALAGVTAAILQATDYTIWCGALGGGAIGALLSVLERLTRGALKVRFETARAHLVMSGISRPVVGALSGAALFVLVEGNIVPLKVGAGADATARGLFFAGIAFLAGFSERLVKDVFGNAASSMAGPQQEGPAATNEPKLSGEAVPKAQAD